MTMPSKHPGPLSDIRVVEFAGLAPISVGGMILSDLGAEVIRVDRRDHSADTHANTLRRGRKSISLDLKHPDGLQIAKQLVGEADVLLEAYRPGVMERLKLGPKEMLDLNPGLVYGRLTGWGQTGPIAHAAGHDITYLALTGALYPLGPADGPPTPPMNYVADMAGGVMFLITGVLSALHERARSSKGQVVDAAMINGVPMIAASVLRALAEGTWRGERGGHVLDGSAPFYRCYECQRGGYIAVGAIEPEFYAQFVDGLGFALDDLPPQRDRATWPAVTEQFAARIRQRSRAEWERQFEGTDACVAPVLSFTEAPHHPQMMARGAFVDVNGTWQPAPVPTLSRTPQQAGDQPPLRGQHTVEILQTLGRSEAEIKELLSSGAAISAEDIA